MNLIVCVSLAILWCVASGHKLTAFAVFAATLDDYRIVPKLVLRPAAIFIIALELGLGVALLVPATRSPALVTSAVLHEELSRGDSGICTAFNVTAWA